MVLLNRLYSKASQLSIFVVVKFSICEFVLSDTSVPKHLVVSGDLICEERLKTETLQLVVHY